MTDRALRILQASAAISRFGSISWVARVAERAGAAVGPRLLPVKSRQLERHLSRVAPAAGLDAAAGLGSYARYWVETFRLSHLEDEVLDRGFSFVNYHHIVDVRAAGFGPIILLPHLGGWEWAAAWLCRIADVPVTAVAEQLEPPEVFEWFTSMRSEWGVDVVPLGPNAFGSTLGALRAGAVTCLLADRDIGGTGVEVDFFGEKTTLPVGPALLAFRSGSPVLPTAVYFSGDQRVCFVGEPIWPDDYDDPKTKSKHGRARFATFTQRLASELEALIRLAPDQWHLLEPNWPSDLTQDVP